MDSTQRWTRRVASMSKEAVWWLRTANAHLAKVIMAMAVPRTPMRVTFTDREDLAYQLVLLARQVGDRIKSDLENEARKDGGYLEGVEHMYKSADSLLRKFNDKYGHLSDDELLMKITDFVRFTVVFHPSIYAKAIQDMIWAMEGKGYRVVDEENTWRPGDPYSALHFILEDPSENVPFELQFHTEESYQTKSYAIHALYEEFRAGGTSIERKRELYDIMAKYWDDVEIPAGVLDFLTEEQQKFYPRP